jgi:hypothetical protein
MVLMILSRQVAATRVRSRLRHGVFLIVAGALSFLTTEPAAARQSVTTPFEQFGFNLGDDYHLANYTELSGYWTTLARESDRMTLETIGETAEGRPMVMAVITSPENHQNLEEYEAISRRLALAEGLTEDEARDLARRGRTVVWINGGLHATETLGAQQVMELVYQMVSRDDPETLRILDETILLAVCANPDGLELVADWYMRRPVPEERSLEDLPRLYQEYTGHDNNRDFYMSSQPETRAINRVLYSEWFPQIVYDHHQTAPPGTVLFAPPFRDPFNYNLDPLIITSVDLVAGAIHSRLLAEGKPGATRRSGATYSTWWNGGLRTTPYFHNMIGLLTETIGSPNPIEIPFDADLQLPRGDLPSPIEPRTWHFSQSIEYSMSANRAVLDLASRYRDTLLFNMWRMGMNSIERGSRDSWTITPDRLDAGGNRPGDAGGNRPGMDRLRDPDLRDPRGYILPADQPDFMTATKFADALLLNGVRVERATERFDAGGRSYAAGSLVVRTAQAFRPHILDMFEPQDHPDDFAYPGAAPTPPYDTSGWTLAFQMGVEFDRILEGFDDAFDGGFEPIEERTPIPEGGITGPPDALGFLFSHAPNDAFIALNRLVDTEDVYWLTEEIESNGADWPAGTMYVSAGTDTRRQLEILAFEFGLSFEGVDQAPRGPARRVRAPRIGLWDEYGGSESSGWTRFVLEQFEFDFERVFAPQLNDGDLGDRYDVLIFADGGIPVRTELSRRDTPVDVPEGHAHQVGEVSIARTVPALGEFLEDGGTVLTIGRSTALARHLGLGVNNALTDRQAGVERPLGREQFYIPGSILDVDVDRSHPLAYGMGDGADVFFNDSPAFEIEPGAGGVTAVARYGDAPLRSGWAWGEERLEGTAAVVEIEVGDGRLVLFGPEVAFRAQSHGTFKFLFNGIYYGSTEEVRLGE